MDYKLSYSVRFNGILPSEYSKLNTLMGQCPAKMYKLACAPLKDSLACAPAHSDWGLWWVAKTESSLYLMLDTGSHNRCLAAITTTNGCAYGYFVYIGFLYHFE